MRKIEFYKKYFESIKKKFTFKKSKEDLFISSIIDFFKLPANLEMINEADTSKRASNKNDETDKFLIGKEMENYWVHIPKQNHCTIKK